MQTKSFCHGSDRSQYIFCPLIHLLRKGKIRITIGKGPPMNLLLFLFSLSFFSFSSRFFSFSVFFDKTYHQWLPLGFPPCISAGFSASRKLPPQPFLTQLVERPDRMKILIRYRSLTSAAAFSDAVGGTS